MARDVQHQNLNYTLSEVQHHYGSRVHIVSSPLMLSWLAQLGSPSTRQPLANKLLSFMYHHLLGEVIDLYFPKKNTQVNTRMKSMHPEAVYEGEIIDPETPCVCVDLARAGTYPSHLCYDKLNYLICPDLIRQDHFYIARKINERGEVVGVDVSGSKIGGSVDKAIVLFPDPMGATGVTISEVYHHYKNKVGGKPRMMIAMHLIVTPEYIKKVTQDCPDLYVFAIRLDRGLSNDSILREAPGKKILEEVGLNEHQYIVPGAGGLGEILNNSYC
jgi:uracil phosphoribosyltransferase